MNDQGHDPGRDPWPDAGSGTDPLTGREVSARVRREDVIRTLDSDD
jgi:hypothetical protein